MGRRGSKIQIMLTPILYIIVAMSMFFLLFHSPNENDTNSNHRYRHRRLLLLRFDSTHSANFYQSEKQQHIHNSDVDSDDTNRIIHLFPKIDVAPTDWFVSLDELTQWNLKQAQDEVLHISKKEMNLHDKDHDGFVSFSESGPPSWLQKDAGSYDSGNCWWKEEHFNASDADGDGLLNLTEFNDFLNPSESNNPKLQQWLCKAEVRERDTDRDGKVNFKEFFHGLFDLVRSYDEETHNNFNQSDDSVYASARVLFSQLDKDGDRYLSDVELRPIIGKLHPSWHHYAKQQAEYIISQAENDKDGLLTLADMITHPYLFYSAIFNNDRDEYDDSHNEMF